ncbi:MULTISPECIES: GNAT family N-acetyltransferase [unclassified Photobacterium]|uniref:GNAT family N-acetyltransferase n=1 Tax=unclassified Photobacterium TaxID=2628852 RepID=UPI001EDD9920|nr:MULTISPECIES: GNAT family N-acetyltransferase [unclassified Photobacterium]MCG3866290.1 GNAT family N-acetyltransferase [Photobacterium sp. Ph6]MCG3877816.1 GNAT family N-acetyltransferase [Photobacterium sp. Ph5]
MSQIIYRQLDPIRLPLVNKIYKSFYPSGKAKRDEIIWVAESNHSIIASVRFKTIDNMQLLTGMLVAPEYRLQGIAYKLIEACRSQINRQTCYCFAFQELEVFYQKSGFQTIDSETLPNNIKQRFQRYANSGKNLIPMVYIN